MMKIKSYALFAEIPFQMKKSELQRGIFDLLFLRGCREMIFIFFIFIDSLSVWVIFHSVMWRGYQRFLGHQIGEM